MSFSRQEYRSGLPFPSLGHLPNPGTEPTSPALAGRFFTTVPPGKFLQWVSLKDFMPCFSLLTVCKMNEEMSFSVQFSRSVGSGCDPWPPSPSPTPGVYSNLCPLNRWCHPTISSSVIPFSPRPQSFSIKVFSNESVLHITVTKVVELQL